MKVTRNTTIELSDEEREVLDKACDIVSAISNEVENVNDGFFSYNEDEIITTIKVLLAFVDSNKIYG